MAEQFNVLTKLFEIISNIQDYDSPDKIDDLKRELIFLRDNDSSSTIFIADYDEELSDVISNAAPSSIGYLFCFPGIKLNGLLTNIPGSLKIVPVSTALAGITFSGITINDCGLFAGAYLRNCNFRNSDLSGMDLTGADLTGATCTHTIFSGAKLHNANFSGVSLLGAVLPEGIDSKAKFKEVVGKGNWNPVTTIWVDGTPLGN